MIAWVDTLQSFVPDLRRRPNAPNSRQRRCRRRRRGRRALNACRAPRAPRAPAHCVCPQPPLPARQQVDSACVPGYTIFRASLPTCICAPTARVLRTSPPSSRARWPPRPARPCVLSLPAFARARALWTPAASPLCSAAPHASLPRLKQKPLDACDRVVLGWDSAFARRAAHDPPGSRRDACSCKP